MADFNAQKFCLLSCKKKIFIHELRNIPAWTPKAFDFLKSGRILKLDCDMDDVGLMESYLVLQVSEEESLRFETMSFCAKLVRKGQPMIRGHGRQRLPPMDVSKSAHYHHSWVMTFFFIGLSIFLLYSIHSVVQLG